MRLTRMRVKDFKCVLDSEWFKVGDLTCLVGKNESGKTALLEALEKLNSVQESRAAFDEINAYPRMRLNEYQRSGEVATPIETEWELSPDEEDHINGLVGAPVLGKRIVGLSKDYKNKLNWTVDIDCPAATAHYLDSSPLTQAERVALGDPHTTSDLLKALEGLSERTPNQETLRATLKELLPAGSLGATIEHYLRTQLPKFLYSSSIDRLPGQVSLRQLTADIASNGVDRDAGNKVFLALLSMVGTTPQDIGQIGKFEPLIAQLEAVGNDISQRVFRYWTQNKHLAVKFRFDEGEPKDEPPFDTGKVFRTRIENRRHGVTLRFDERSAGFIWFFSFLVWFTEVSRLHGDNLVVLLDEPGLSLHARAQADLLRFIKTELLPKYQVIYTTHSPFMIDALDLLSCRTVEDVTGPKPEEAVLGTKVGDDALSKDPDTLFPLQAAIGYDITQTLFVGEHCLLVEGVSDLLLLQWFSGELQRQGRPGLDQRWTVTPCGGIAKVASFVALFSGSGLHVAALTDYGQGDKARVRSLRESELLREGHVLTAAMFVEDATEADVEDIVGREMYAALVNAAYGLKGKKALPTTRPADAPARVTEEVDAHFKLFTAAEPEYDHFRSAEYLVTTGAAGLPGVEGAVERFENLFRTANALLP